MEKGKFGSDGKSEYFSLLVTPLRRGRELVLANNTKDATTTHLRAIFSISY